MSEIIRARVQVQGPTGRWKNLGSINGNWNLPDGIAVSEYAIFGELHGYRSFDRKFRKKVRTYRIIDPDTKEVLQLFRPEDKHPEYKENPRRRRNPAGASKRRPKSAAEKRKEDAALRKMLRYEFSEAEIRQMLKSNPAGRRIKRKIMSRAQWRWAYAAEARGEITPRQLKDLKKGVVYSRLPAKVGQKKRKPMARKKRRTAAQKAATKKMRAGLKRYLAKQRKKPARRRKTTARRAKPRRATRARSPRRRVNYEITGKRVPAAAYKKRWYSVSGKKMLINGQQAGAYASRGKTVRVTTAPKAAKVVHKRKPAARKRKVVARRRKPTVRRRKTTKKRAVRKTARRAYARKPSSTRGKRWYKVGVKKRLLNKTAAKKLRVRGKKVRLTTAPKSKTTRKGMGRKTARRAYAPTRRKAAPKRRKAAPKRRKVTRKRKVVRRRKQTPAQRRASLRNIKKAQAARRRKARGRRGRPLKKLGKRSVVRRAVKAVKRRRPKVKRRAIRRLVTKDARRKVHKRGRGRVRRLASDTIFDLDYASAAIRQRLGRKMKSPGTVLVSRRSRYLKVMRKTGRHPSHMSKRRVPAHTRRGWKEFAGYSPNTITTLKKSPVKGSFNGVWIDTLEGVTADGQTVKIKPPQKSPLYFIWGNGGRTFEVVGSTSALTSLAGGMARAGGPIRLLRLNYFAPTYPQVEGKRRTKKSKMYLNYTHKITHEVYLTWNEKSGSKARFPIVVRGSRGKGLVSRAGIKL